MDARRKPYVPRPAVATSRFLDLIDLLDHTWRGQHASYRVLHQGQVKTWSWATIKKMFPVD